MRLLGSLEEWRRKEPEKWGILTRQSVAFSAPSPLSLVRMHVLPGEALGKYCQPFFHDSMSEDFSMEPKESCTLNVEFKLQSRSSYYPERCTYDTFSWIPECLLSSFHPPPAQYSRMHGGSAPFFFFFFCMFSVLPNATSVAGKCQQQAGLRSSCLSVKYGGEWGS